LANAAAFVLLRIAGLENIEDRAWPACFVPLAFGRLDGLPI